MARDSFPHWILAGCAVLTLVFTVRIGWDSLVGESKLKPPGTAVGTEAERPPLGTQASLPSSSADPPPSGNSFVRPAPLTAPHAVRTQPESAGPADPSVSGNDLVDSAPTTAAHPVRTQPKFARPADPPPNVESAPVWLISGNLSSGEQALLRSGILRVLRGAGPGARRPAQIEVEASVEMDENRLLGQFAGATATAVWVITLADGEVITGSIQRAGGSGPSEIDARRNAVVYLMEQLESHFQE